MYDLLEGWLSEAGSWPIRMPGWVAGNPVVSIGAVAMILAIAGRHRRTVGETLFLSLLALVMFRFWDIPAILLAVGALLNVTHAAERRKIDGRLHAVTRRIDAIQSSLDGFLGALDRRTREADGRATSREPPPGKIIGPQAAVAAPRSPMNGAEPGTASPDA